MAPQPLSTQWTFVRLGRLLGSRVLARGVLETLWEPCWLIGDPYVGTSADIEAICEWKGERGALTKALLTAGAPKGPGFIEPYAGDVRDKTEPHYQIHDFLAHCPDWVRRRREREEERGRPRQCANCGGDYFARDPRARYCGARCRQAGYRARVHEMAGRV